MSPWVFDTAWPSVEVRIEGEGVYRGTKVFGWVFWKDKFGEFHHAWIGFKKGGNPSKELT